MVISTSNRFCPIIDVIEVSVILNQTGITHCSTISIIESVIYSCFGIHLTFCIKGIHTLLECIAVLFQTIGHVYIIGLILDCRIRSIEVVVHTEAVVVTVELTETSHRLAILHEVGVSANRINTLIVPQNRLAVHHFHCTVFPEVIPVRFSIRVILNEIDASIHDAVTAEVVGLAVDFLPDSLAESRTFAVLHSLAGFHPNAGSQNTVFIENVSNTIDHMAASHYLLSRSADVIPIRANGPPAGSQSTSQCVAIAVFCLIIEDAGVLTLADAVFAKVVIELTGTIRGGHLANASVLDTVLNVTAIFRPAIFRVGQDTINVVLAVGPGTGKQIIAVALQDAINHLISMAQRLFRFAPANDRLTGVTVGSASITSLGAGSIHALLDQFCVMVMPGILSIFQLSFNGNRTSEIVGAVHKALHYITVDGDNGAITGGELLFGVNRLSNCIVNTIPGPDTNGNAHQGRI